jgi:non-canonical (house-cleaning) NTP pyrophosphatase
VGNDYGFGIEGGLIAIPQTKSGHMEVGICAIYDGKQIHLGMTPGFEWPTKVIDGILNKGYDGSQAMREAGITAEEKIGANKGVINTLSNGRINRTEYNKQAVIAALIHLEHPEYYE